MDVMNLDARTIEPKDRFATITTAYGSIPAGGVLTLTVDHDPKCMYYALRATEPEGSFLFSYLESGPEVWRVEVRKTAPAPADVVGAAGG
jgi:uncharacterized protein (DUF2249 family)